MPRAEARCARRRPRATALVLGLTAVGLCLGACAGPSAGSNGNATVSQVGGPPETSATYPGALLFPKAYPKPDVTLTDTSGAPYNLTTDTQGRLTLVYFGYTHCPDLCPLNMYTAATAIGDLPASDRARVTVVFVTTDPDRDTPSVIRTWLNHFDDEFVGLTGTITQIRQAEETTGLPLSFAEHTVEAGASYTVVHAGYILVYTHDGLAHLEFPAEITPSQESHDLATLLTHGWQA